MKSILFSVFLGTLISTSQFAHASGGIPDLNKPVETHSGKIIGLRIASKNGSTDLLSITESSTGKELKYYIDGPRVWIDASSEKSEKKDYDDLRIGMRVSVTEYKKGAAPDWDGFAYKIKAVTVQRIK